MDGSSEAATADATPGAGAPPGAPALIVLGMIEHALALAATWPAWDGRPIQVGDRLFTPHKAVRRIADHCLDHLAEMEDRLAGRTPLPDRWHGSAVLTPADLAPFTGDDLDEARSRLTRIGRIWADRIGALDEELLDRSPGEGWSFRDLAVHLGSTYYADSVGDLHDPAR
ncbi:hypothetical protein [Actinomadura parmotrematis]|uniref:Mycothiol-dependent maleylpyruvate isomerase metal-binding domain-containing protein n=1 Tax=Actinomadura parmotrematis TaxID=2864039 RepID=A0ABS7G149_9ACTN|nr:hypothetical protein [Actinomadura parmotrematis]MBW8486440.1 hypothetical protein [Actinomadura parmotrematis]